MYPQSNPYQPAPAWQPPRRWWQHPALIVTLLVLFPPAGIVLAWLGLWTNRTKTVATVLSALWFVVVMLMDPPAEKDADDPKPAVTVTATATPTPEPTSESPTPTPEPTTETPTPTPEPTTAAPTTRTPEPTTQAPTTPAPKPTTQAPKPAPTTPKPKPKPVQTTQPPETAEPEPEAYYANCDAVRAAGAAPIHAGDPGYSRRLDRDGDGVGCEN
ncbi:excalibur calcium-binding domain-containing protein [Streptomyces sp. NPDC056503]|uniref:excalibur calcium-binding domain-containing protein n=1 Tax=Streptomyces sp. NPDC056503 TaxID=3345842 RepID=UPI0036822330